MEVVLLVVAVLGIALIVVPRVQRRRNTPRVRRTPTVKRRAIATGVARSAAVATWTPDQSAGDDGWDDDLGWEGIAEPEPEAREAWERWRATESPLAAAPAAEPVEPPELPSVERWRATADDDGWDDDLGWEGTDEPASGNGHVEPRIWTSGGGNGNGRVPEVPHGAEPVTSAFVAAATTDEVATRVGHSERIDHDSKPAGREWGATAHGNGAAVVTAPQPKSRKVRIHPVLLVAIYAAAGIGLVVLASTALLGGSSSPKKSAPPAKQTPAPQATPSAEPAAAGTAADEPTDADEVTAAKAAAARKARSAYRRERTGAQHSERRQAARVASDARRKQRERSKSHSGTGGTVRTPPAIVNPTPPPPRNFTPPRRPTCEFCIG